MRHPSADDHDRADANLGSALADRAIGRRFVDWTISNTCATQSPPNPPGSTAIGPRRRLLCFILNGIDGIATEQRVSGDCTGIPGGGTPATFQVDGTVPGQPGTRTRQLVAMQITGGNVCIRGTITYADGSTQEMEETMWRVTTSGAPAMGYVVRAAPDSPGGTVVRPIGLGSRGCAAV
ncbi:hypothetical protein E2493_19750 [Sphingomonas parva]|uniref:Uncharacterized protein n=1 Tax=Sphingomonas parva TaxID=2555898 RepID=A0A4Y8ZM35_9SPHN|nr:hypothetical protein [Sphingomonas parva]TFI56517.1 hypothetical protein E2493_19750 [Sphingomonas parva]